ncbi:MAG: ATP synthase F1 subunit epsilon [Bacteroidales bacterium]|jgi:F-type H+-transporting ATPase subunit epsilon|nr:ATP synthase F1 subunit epsilon [Bacteroidales bacterium]
MKINILTPQRALFKGECKLVQLPGVDGLFEILDHHAPIVSLLGKGKVKVQDHNGHDTFYEIIGGFLQVDQNDVTLLVEE